MALNPHHRRRLAIALVLGSVAVAAPAVAWFYLSGPRDGFQTGPSHQRKAASDAARTAVEAAVFRYETETPRRRLSPTRSLHVRKVECSDVNVPRFRGQRAFRCAISFKEPRTGFDAACYAPFGRALYEVGGCFPPPRDMGAGKSLLLTRVSR